jgi:hypothetical protein
MGEIHFFLKGLHMVTNPPIVGFAPFLPAGTRRYKNYLIPMILRESL